ncbi:MAG: Efflux ABC transporter, permease protein, partial [uncultured Thermomicrobiales bacterium]
DAGDGALAPVDRGSGARPSRLSRLVPAAIVQHVAALLRRVGRGRPHVPSGGQAGWVATGRSRLSLRVERGRDWRRPLPRQRSGRVSGPDPAGRFRPGIDPPGQRLRPGLGGRSAAGPAGPGAKRADRLRVRAGRPRRGVDRRSVAVPAGRRRQRRRRFRRLVRPRSDALLLDDPGAGGGQRLHLRRRDAVPVSAPPVRRLAPPLVPVRDPGRIGDLRAVALPSGQTRPARPARLAPLHRPIGLRVVRRRGGVAVAGRGAALPEHGVV